MTTEQNNGKCPWPGRDCKVCMGCLYVEYNRAIKRTSTTDEILATLRKNPDAYNTGMSEEEWMQEEKRC